MILLLFSSPGHREHREQGEPQPGGGQRRGGGLHQRGQQAACASHLVDRQCEARSVSQLSFVYRKK